MKKKNANKASQDTTLDAALLLGTYMWHHFVPREI